MGKYGVQLPVAWPTIVSGNKHVGEPSAELEKRSPLGLEAPYRSSEVVDAASGAAAVAVEGAVMVELQAGGVVGMKSGSHGVAYATAVKRRLKPVIALLRTGYP
jgi:hypothetical protein